MNTVKNNQPEFSELPSLPGETTAGVGPVADAPEEMPGDGSGLAKMGPADLSGVFITMLESIGGSAFIVSGFPRIATILHELFPGGRRIVSGCSELAAIAEMAASGDDPHTLENIDLAILRAHFGVAENGACWITEDRMITRVLPFIAQDLALIIRRKDIVANMHEGYERIAVLERDGSYGFATFIAGPSKTADIEQSLVLGAHGPRSLVVFLLDEEISDAGFY